MKDVLHVGMRFASDKKDQYGARIWFMFPWQGHLDSLPHPAQY